MSGGMIGFQAEPYTRPACCGWRESIQSGADDYAVGNLASKAGRAVQASNRCQPGNG